MQIDCVCGTVFTSRSVPCPDKQDGCCVAHFDESSFICPNCLQDCGPAIVESVRQGRIKQHVGIGIINYKALERIDLI